MKHIFLPIINGGAYIYGIRGIYKAFEFAGHKVAYWDGTDEHIKSFKPDVYIGCSGHKQNFPKWAKQEYGTKTAYHVNPYSSSPLEKKEETWPDINEPRSTIEWVVAQEPNFVFGFACRGAINRHWDKWTNDLGIRVYGEPTAGDHLSFKKVKPDPSMECDVAFVGGYWPYKAINIDKYLEPVRKKHNTIIYGWGGWDGRSRGAIDDNDILKLFSSAKIGPCVSEPHTTVYGIDIPERIFKVPLCGLAAISDPVPTMRDYFPYDIMPMASTPDEYVDLVGYYLKNEDKRLELVSKQHRHVIKNHTYMNRIMTFLAGFGFVEESMKVQEIINKME